MTDLTPIGFNNFLPQVLSDPFFRVERGRSPRLERALVFRTDKVVFSRKFTFTSVY